MGDQRPEFGEIAVEIWVVGEETANEVVACVHPTLDSEEKRRDVIEYIQRLIRTTLGCEVYPYGSVPLKTYLPDGDIDLTAITSLTVADMLPRDVLAVLQGEENNRYAEYQIKDTQFIDAEVKLVKCLVDNIVVDLSFNQLGGLSTLCFLEQVDRRVDRNHLFKRSIILVKTWCYYESRILGAHHGLISTYAMETLVLYIFHLFHASLDGPLAVLYKFLDYFSKFDWDNYCISLNGPVRKSCLPDIVVDMAHSQQKDFLISEEFLNNCIDMFSVPFRDADTKSLAFPSKHLNIIDPLKVNNNLGRSVNRGNYYRIRSAFRYGARKLGRILMLPRERIADEMKSFFANTFERHGRNARILTLLSHSRLLPEEKTQFNSLGVYSESNMGGDFELDKYSTEINHIPMVSKIGQSIAEMGMSASLPVGEMYPRPTNYQFDCSAPARYSSGSVSQHYTPRSRSYSESGEFNYWMLNEEKPVYTIHEKAVSDTLIGEQRGNYYRPCNVGYCRSDNYDRLSSFSSGIVSPDGSISEDLALDFKEKDLVDIAGSPENSNPLSNLTGDYDSNIRSLLYGQFCHGHPSSAHLMHNPPPNFGSQFVGQMTWNTAPHQSMSMTYSSSPHFVDNRVNMGWATHPLNIPGQSNPMFYTDERHTKPRGTGTYLPNGCAFRERPSRGRGRHNGSGNDRQYQRRQRPRSAPMLPEKKFSDKGDTSREQLPKAPSPAVHHEKTEVPQESNTSSSDESPAANFALGLQKLEFGSLGNLSDGSSVRVSDASSGWDTISSQAKSAEPLCGSNYERVGNQSYHLKDEDFPPLAV